MADEHGALVPIGRFSTICHLTIKALRHYDEIGLLRPALVDPHSGYRYYRLDQVATAVMIRTLRAAEMPLSEIGVVIDAPDSDAARTLLLRQRQRLHERIAAQQTAITTLDRLTMAGVQGSHTSTIELRFVPVQTLVSERLSVAPAALGTAIGGAIGATRALLARHGAQPTGMPVTIYHAIALEDDLLPIEVGWPVAAPLPAEGRIGMGTLGGVTVARTVHQGPYDTIAEAFAAVAGWIQQHGHETAGAPWETYLTSPDEGTAPATTLTEICWPIH